MDLSMKWRELLENRFFQDVPYKVELNKFGQILMSPASNQHGILQYQIGREIENKKQNGTIIIECSILTSEGVKVADVAWASGEFIEEFGSATPYKKAPEICIEVISPGNSKAEINEKIRLYLEKGAFEVWTVSNTRKIKFFTHTGEIKKSKIVGSIKI
jgi:Uma2 family endonuclease